MKRKNSVSSKFVLTLFVLVVVAQVEGWRRVLGVEWRGRRLIPVVARRTPQLVVTSCRQTDRHTRQ